MCRRGSPSTSPRSRPCWVWCTWTNRRGRVACWASMGACGRVSRLRSEPLAHGLALGGHPVPAGAGGVRPGHGDRPLRSVQHPGMGTLVDLGGGVTLTVEAPFTTADGRLVSTGPQELDGAAAMAYLRAPDAAQPEGSLVRRQQAILQAVLGKAASVRGLGKVVQILDAIGTNIRFGPFSPVAMLELGNTFRSICTPATLKVATLPGRHETVTDPLSHRSERHWVVAEPTIGELPAVADRPPGRVAGSIPACALAPDDPLDGANRAGLPPRHRRGRASSKPIRARRGAGSATAEVLENGAGGVLVASRRAAIGSAAYPRRRQVSTGWTCDPNRFARRRGATPGGGGAHRLRGRSRPPIRPAARARGRGHVGTRRPISRTACWSSGRWIGAIAGAPSARRWSRPWPSISTTCPSSSVDEAGRPDRSPMPCGCRRRCSAWRPCCRDGDAAGRHRDGLTLHLLRDAATGGVPRGGPSCPGHTATIPYGAYGARLLGGNDAVDRGGGTDAPAAQLLPVGDASVASADHGMKPAFAAPGLAPEASRS